MAIHLVGETIDAKLREALRNTIARGLAYGHSAATIANELPDEIHAAGWRFVPAVATDEMLESWCGQKRTFVQGGIAGSTDWSDSAAYDAMLAAAPDVGGKE